jgi:hypothetical protein
MEVRKHCTKWGKLSASLSSRFESRGTISFTFQLFETGGTNYQLHAPVALKPEELTPTRRCTGGNESTRTGLYFGEEGCSLSFPQSTPLVLSFSTKSSISIVHPSALKMASVCYFDTPVTSSHLTLRRIPEHRHQMWMTFIYSTSLTDIPLFPRVAVSGASNSLTAQFLLYCALHSGLFGFWSRWNESNWLSYTFVLCIVKKDSKYAYNHRFYRNAFFMITEVLYFYAMYFLKVYSLAWKKYQLMAMRVS